MNTHIALEGLRRFLSDVDRRVAPGTQLSTLLQAQGFSAEQVAALRHTHLEAFVAACRALIQTRLLQRHDGERLFQVIDRRYGLADETPHTLKTISMDLGVTRERVRQLEGKAIKICRAQRMAWSESIAHIAAQFVDAPATTVAAADLGEMPVFAGSTVGATPADGWPSPPSARPVGWEVTREQVLVMVAAIEKSVGRDLTSTLVARILVGHEAPEVQALVAHHNVPHYGTLRGHTRSAIGLLIAELRSLPARTPETTPIIVAPDPVVRDDAPVCDARVTEVALMVANIRAAVAAPISPLMVAHILFGSRGPQVDALRARDHPPHDGALGALGIKHVIALVRAVERAPRTPGMASPEENGSAAS